MQYCRKCNVRIAGNKRCCPLCQGEIEVVDGASEDDFPIVPKRRFSRNFAIRLVSFISIALIIVALTINFMFPSDSWSFLLVCAIIVSLWATVTVGINQRRNIFRNISYELFLVCVLSVLFDLSTGWRKWSLNYVIPFSAIVSMGSIFLVSKLMHISKGRGSFYLLLVAVYGIVPFVLILTDIITVIYPSAVCVCCSFISCSAIFLFNSKSLWLNLKKKFHI